jgi:isopentenyl-diphosphate delta-isomerase
MQEPTNNYVVLVDTKGNVLGTEEKLAAHQKGVLHSAFSVFIFNEKGEMLLQQRAFTKYHFGGLWSNTCCSHPRLNESALQAGQRRLSEELGFTTELREVFTFIYKAQDEKTQLIEHERDTVLIGFYNKQVDNFNPTEVNAVKWISISQLFLWLTQEPHAFSYWFKTALLELKNRKLLSVRGLKKLFEA